jgi:hypothetical protein
VFGRMDRSIPEDQIKTGMKVKTRITNLENDRFTYEFVVH